MNEFKYQLTQFLFLILLGVGAYWALTHLDTGVSYTRENIVDISDAVDEPDDIANTVDSETVLVADNEPAEEIPQAAIEVVTEPVTTPLNQSLITDLQKLVDDGVTMDNGSNGSRVGVVQEFLELYFVDKTVSIDNDFGPTTKGLVRDFQVAELNGGDGRVGPNTLSAMISYLENQ